MKGTKDLLEFWEDQVRHSHSSSNYFFRKSPSHYHMMLLVMNSYKQGEKLSVEELKTKLFKTSRPKSALIINEACENNFFYLEKTSTDQRKKNIKPTDAFVKEFDEVWSIRNGAKGMYIMKKQGKGKPKFYPMKNKTIEDIDMNYLNSL